MFYVSVFERDLEKRFLREYNRLSIMAPEKFREIKNVAPYVVLLSTEKFLLRVDSIAWYCEVVCGHSRSFLSS